MFSSNKFTKPVTVLKFFLWQVNGDMILFMSSFSSNLFNPSFVLVFANCNRDALGPTGTCAGFETQENWEN